MTQAEEATAQGGASAAIFVALVGSEQGWLELCRTAATGDAEGIARLQRADAPEVLALREFGRPSSVAGDRIEVTVSSFDAEAAAVIAEVALATAGIGSTANSAAHLLAHCAQHGLVSAGMRSDLAAARLDDGSPTKHIAQLLSDSNSPARGFAALLVDELSPGGHTRTVSHVTVPVLFGGEARETTALGPVAPGASGKLTLERRASGPVGLHPDPATMAFLRTDEAMVEAIRNAWITSPMAGSHACVVWSLRMNTDTGNPAVDVGGGSLGGAFAVALDELASRAGRLRSLAARYMLDPHKAVSAKIDDTGLLQPVKGLDVKIAAAGRAGLNIVVAEECFAQARKAVPSGLMVTVEQAADAGAAVRVTRTHANPRFRRTIAVAALLTAIALGAVLMIVDARQGARVQSLASSLATQAVTLANSDPRRAALFALTSQQLHPSDESREAMSVVGQNNLNTSASRQVTTGPVSQVAASATTVLVSDATTSLKVLTMPDLEPLGEIPVDEPGALLAAGAAYEDEFAVVDGGDLELYAGAPGRVPVLVESVSLSFAADREIFGPYVDSRGGYLVISELFEGVYWSPATRDAIEFDLREDAWLQRNSAELAQITAASGFGPYRGSDGTPTNEASRDRFVMATNLGQVLELRLEESAPTDPWRAEPVPVWLDNHHGVASGRGTRIVSLGWADDELLVGTDAGISARDLDSNQETAFPYGGVTERIDAIVSADRIGRVAAALTPSGVTLLTPTRSSPLHDTTAAAATHYPVQALAQAGPYAWVAGRSNGVLTVIDPGNRPAIMTSASAKAIASDGTLLMSSGTQQRASAVTEQDLGDEELSHMATYPIGDALPEEPYLNDVAGDGTTVVAGGLVPSTGGVVLVWQSPDEEPHVLDFAAPTAETPGTDIVATVALDAEAGVVAAYKPDTGELALWSTNSWDRTASVDLREEPAAQDGVAVMSASADGTWLAVADSDRVTVLRTATGEVVSSFPAAESRAVIAPDGSRIALLSETDVTVVTSAGEEQGWVAIDGFPSAAAWSPDGSVLAVASWDTGRIMFLDTATFAPLGLPWRNPSGYIPLRLLWSIDGSTLLIENGASAGGFYEVKGVDRLEPANTTWESRLCALAPTPLSKEEWADAGGGGVAQPDPCGGVA